MKRALFVLFVFAPASLRAQSVAQTVTSLNAKVTALEGRRDGTGSPLVVAVSDPSGGQLTVLNSSNTGHILITTDAAGGQMFVRNASGKTVVAAYAEDTKGGGLHIWGDSPSPKSRLALGMSGNIPGLWLRNSEGNELLKATLATNGQGETFGYLEVNGQPVHDYAEVFDIANCDGLKPGSVIAMAADGQGIQLSGQAYDAAAVGVLSGAGEFQPGMKIGSRADGSSDLPVAVSGQVYVRVNGEAGGIKVGDLLVSSSMPGVAMRGADSARLTGTVIGKALQPFGGTDEGLIRMLVLNR